MLKSSPPQRSLSSPICIARFNERREQLLAAHRRRQRLDAGEPARLLPDTQHIRDSNWASAPIPEDILDRRVEITSALSIAK